MTTALLDNDGGRSDAPEPTPANTLTGFLWSVSLATLVAWFVSRVLNHLLVGEQLIPLPAVESVGMAEYLALTLFSSLLVTAAIAYVATLSSLRGCEEIQLSELVA